MKILIGIFLAVSAVNSYGAINYFSDANNGYSQSGVSNVSKYYKPIELNKGIKQNLEYLKPSEKVELIYRNDIHQGINYVLSSGYRLVGHSEFLDRTLADSVFIAQAKKVGAQRVLIHKQGVTQSSYGVEDDLNNLNHGYHYYAAFFVKDNFFKEPNALGLSFGDIPLEKTKLYQRNTGAYVFSVIQNSRAYTSNILVEDVITAINDKKVLKREDVNQIKDAELKKSKTLNFTITRIVNNEPREVQIPVSFN